MPGGASTLGEFPVPLLRVSCAKCRRRAGQHHTAKVRERYSSVTAMRGGGRCGSDGGAHMLIAHRLLTTTQPVALPRVSPLSAQSSARSAKVGTPHPRTDSQSLCRTLSL